MEVCFCVGVCAVYEHLHVSVRPMSNLFSSGKKPQQQGMKK